MAKGKADATVSLTAVRALSTAYALYRLHPCRRKCGKRENCLSLHRQGRASTRHFRSIPNILSLSTVEAKGEARSCMWSRRALARAAASSEGGAASIAHRHSPGAQARRGKHPHRTLPARGGMSPRTAYPHCRTLSFLEEEPQADDRDACEGGPDVAGDTGRGGTWNPGPVVAVRKG